MVVLLSGIPPRCLGNGDRYHLEFRRHAVLVQHITGQMVDRRFGKMKGSEQDAGPDFVTEMRL